MCNIIVAISIVAGSILGSLAGSAIIISDTKAKYNITNDKEWGS